MKVRLCSTLVKPREVKVQSQTQAETYTVIPSTVWNDGICSCKGFFFKGKCKHLTDVESGLCDYMTKNLETPLGDCPLCGAPLVDFELEPEYDEYVWEPPK